MKTDTLKKMLLMLLCVVSVNMTALGKELVSDVLPIADPYILFYNDTYYAYGTSRADGFEVYSSKDMKSWERSPRLALNKEDSYGDKWFWAPEVYYVEEDKKFYMFYSVENMSVLPRPILLWAHLCKMKRSRFEKKKESIHPSFSMRTGKPIFILFALQTVM